MNPHSVLSALDRFGFDVFRYGISLFWQSSILFVGTALLCLALGRTCAGVRHRIWVVSLLVAPLLPFLAWGASRLNTPRAPIPVIRQYAEPIRAPEPVELPVVAGDLPSGPQAEPLPSRPSPSFSLFDYPWALLFLVYACGLSLFIGLTVRAWHEIGKWVRRGTRVKIPRTQTAFREALKRAGVRRDVLLLESAGARFPMTMGFSHPTILLPLGLGASLSDSDLAAVAAHEAAHLRRRDPILFSTLSILRALLFFHPLVWCACRRVLLLAENACDEAVLEAGGRPISYAKLLARLAENLPAHRGAVPILAGILSSKSSFVRRVEMILASNRQTIRRLSRLGLIATVLAGAFSLGIALVFPLTEKREVRSLSLEEIRAGIRDHESRIRTLQYHFEGSCLPSEAFPERPVGVYSEFDVRWDSGFNIAQNGYEREFGTPPAIWGEKSLRWSSWDHERCIWYRSDSPGARIVDKEGTGGEEGLKYLFDWEHLMTSLLGYSHIYFRAELTLSQTLEEYGAKLVDVEPKNVDGHETVVVETECPWSPREVRTGTYYRMRFWIAPDIQFSPVRMEMLKDESNYVTNRWDNIEYDYFDEVALPVSGRLTVYDPKVEETDELMQPKEFTYSGIEINKPMPRETFVIQLPAGTKVSDDITRKTYVVGEESTTQEKPGNSVRVDPVSPLGIPLTQNPGKRTFTVDEIREGIRTHESRIKSLEYRLAVGYDGFSNRKPCPQQTDGTVYWDADWNVGLREMVREPHEEYDQNGVRVESWRAPREFYRSCDVKNKRTVRYTPDHNQGSISPIRSAKDIVGVSWQGCLTRWLGYSYTFLDPCLTLSETMTKYGAGLVEKEPKTIDGHDVVVVEINLQIPETEDFGPAQDRRLRFWIAPDLEFSPLRIEDAMVGAAFAYHSIKYDRISGVLIPVSGVEEFYMEQLYPKVMRESVDGMKQHAPTKRYEFSNIKINGKPRKDLLEIPFAAGTKVNDKITGKTYVVGE